VQEAIIEARKVEKVYGKPGESRIQVIAPTDLSVYPGEILAEVSCAPAFVSSSRIWPDQW
jgi:hypothetical protein